MENAGGGGAEFKRGQTVTQKTAQAGVYPVISGGQQPAYYINQYNRTGQTITVAGSGAYAGFVMFWNEPIFVSDAFSIKANEEVLLPRYVFHFLLNKQSSIFNLKRGSGVPHVYAKDLADFSIPLPPLRVQARIVEILDKFTQLEAELETELEARNKQYDFYRNRLLDFALRDDLAGQVEWKTLGEVAEYVRERIAVDQLCAQTYVGVDNLLPNRAGKKDSNYLPTEGNAIAYQPNDILIGNIRPYLKKIWKADNEGGASADVLVIRSTTQLLVPGYLYHLLADNRFFSYDMQHAKGAKMPRGNKEKILDYVIPLPPLSEQRRIVDFLDRFDTLTNSISEGLPREITLRRKQYEYYRDALLNFPPPAPTS